MRQRNDTSTAWHFAATADTEAHTVAPGETTDHPVLLDGWNAADEPDAPANATDEPLPKPRGRKSSVESDESKGGELR
ncbi:hypothetical protein [Streptomyces mobaraensis]|uniref:Uncharacterized protein n=1 Tax=Streptomyces mobaraensis TaxID=35621 RepID=A0A5N5WCX2_STRMB|nr:hypothetical protein [Streptomyces mobaraensis]KAB7850123.1 hypothetical protein FRZ00_05850 [Streptomyces mobaraensis]